jgi:GTPase SAR1 family protein
MATAGARSGRMPDPTNPVPPPELVEFLRSSEPLSLLITGSPGVGKTTLALSLLASLELPSFYVATRVGRGNILHHFPWLVGSLPPERLVDLEDVRPEGERQEDLMHQLDRLVSTVDPLSAGRRLRDFLNLPEPLARSLGEPPARAGRRVLFIDSWDGLVEPYVHLLGLDELGRSTLEHGLLSLFQLAGCSLVLCAESSSPPALEFLADGVVELRSEVQDGHLTRYICLKKLRGRALHACTNAFTLHQGKFTNCPRVVTQRLNRHDFLEAASLTGDPSRTLRFGIPALDELMGPVEPGDTLLAELDAHGASTPLGFVLVPFWTQAFRAGWNVTFLSDLAHDPAMVRGRLAENLDRGGATEAWRFLPGSSHVVGEDLWKEVMQAIQPRTAIDCSVRTLGTLLGVRGEELLTRLGQMQLRAREKGAVIVFVAGIQDPVLPALSTMVAIHLGMREYHGTYLISGRSPSTMNLVVAVGPRGSDGYPVRYLPMV